MVKPTKVDAETVKRMAARGVFLGGDKPKFDFHDTQGSISFMLDGMHKLVKSMREKNDNILVLQAVNWMFSGNPVAMFAHPALYNEVLSLAETVRLWLVDVFKQHGGEGPEAIERILEPGLRSAAKAAVQATMRFKEGMDEAARRMEVAEARAREEAAEAAAVTPDLEALGESVAGKLGITAPKVVRENDPAAMVDAALELGKLKWPETTTRERARELFIKAFSGPLTHDEHLEIGLEPPPTEKKDAAGPEGDREGTGEPGDGEAVHGQDHEPESLVVPGDGEESREEGSSTPDRAVE